MFNFIKNTPNIISFFAQNENFKTLFQEFHFFSHFSRNKKFGFAYKAKEKFGLLILYSYICSIKN